MEKDVTFSLIRQQKQNDRGAAKVNGIDRTHALKRESLTPFPLTLLLVWAYCVPGIVQKGPAEATNGGEFNAFVHSCMGSTPPRAGMTELHVVVRDLRRVTVEVQLYPLGTADGGLTHVVMIMEETPMCQGLPQAGVSVFGSDAGGIFSGHAGSLLRAG